MSTFDINHRYELVYKRYLERRPVPLDYKTVLGRSVDNGDHGPATGPDLQPNQLIWPELLFTKSAPFGNENIQVANLAGSFPINYFIERYLISLVGRTNRPHDERTILNENGGALVEVLEVGWIYIQPEEPI